MATCAKISVGCVPGFKGLLNQCLHLLTFSAFSLSQSCNISLLQLNACVIEKQCYICFCGETSLVLQMLQIKIHCAAFLCGTTRKIRVCLVFCRLPGRRIKVSGQSSSVCQKQLHVSRPEKMNREFHVFKAWRSLIRPCTKFFQYRTFGNIFENKGS